MATRRKHPNPRPDRHLAGPVKQWPAAILSLGVLVIASTAFCGCGAGASPAPAESSTASSSALAPVFAQIAEMVAPMPVYGLATLPAGAVVPEDWWPVTEVGSAKDYTGPAVANPRVVNAGQSGSEVELVVDYAGGALDIVENFRGDVGETGGREVGQVAGHTATLYEVNGGILVQWSDGGRWYGVFARGIAGDTVVEIALQMQRLPAENTE